MTAHRLTGSGASAYFLYLPSNCPTATVTSSAKTSARKKKKITLGKAKFTIQPGKTAKVKVKLSKRARRLLRSRRKLKSKASAKTADGIGTTKTTSATVKLKQRR